MTNKTYRGFGTRAGGLASYGPDADAALAMAGEMVKALLEGTPPAELAMREVPAFTLAVNRETAKAQGIRLPPGFA